MTAEFSKIGFVGLGSMGGDQVRCLLTLGVPLSVYDVNAAAAAKFAEIATVAGDLAAVAQGADVVGLCVQDDKQVLSCSEELLPHMDAGSIMMVHSTVKPATMVSLGERAAERGVLVIDAAVSRTVMGKSGPFVFCMTAGDEEVIARVRDVIDTYATDTLYVGPLGSAMALKICNNLASWCSIMIGLEAFDVAAAAGVPLDKLMTVMTRNGVLTPPAQAFAAFRNNGGPEELRAVIETQATIGYKDLDLAEGLARDAEAETPITSTARGLVRERLLRLSAK